MSKVAPTPRAAARLLSIALTAAMLTLAGAVAPATGTPEPAGPNVWNSPVYVIGDSITRHGERRLQAREPRWDIDGVPGRNVASTDDLLEARMSGTRAPRHVVVALGSNGHREWSKAHYEGAVAVLPPTTRVTFVTMWRDPSVFGPDHPGVYKRPSAMRAYSRWVRQISQERPNTCLFNWRRVVRHRPHLLSDGVHPTVQGRVVWARGVSRAVRRCAAQPLVD
ncbi:SGNH/GDSL hydrolase family protein [Nocardioides sp.]|uniref:SGNH/GDSL hydrolase family protein n=1 Tax=Nocardioides sp. TaxID=35761 RepID=UPI00273578A3|nr:SGNH/GDSL hydrolase family protein [Nocardioides sp.]MDP3892542.1 SGNH/GDSL hydrolase family protein [Nocardioides sp.]